jgi:hypothetical protein
VAVGERTIEKVRGALNIVDASIDEELRGYRGDAERCGQIGRDIKWRLTPEVLADRELLLRHGLA